jgi:hypothetical protein
MGIQDGKKASQAVREFNQNFGNVDGDVTAIDRLACVLQNRNFGEKHFEQGQACFEKMRAAAQIKVVDQYSYNERAPLNSKKLELGMCYMGIQQGQDGEPLEDQFVPTLLRAVMTPSFLSFSQRALPLFFSSEHIEYRFLQRTGKPMEYDSNDFQRTIAAGLMLAITQVRLMNEKQLVIPTVLPVSDGLYLGHAAACSMKSFYPTDYIISSRNEQTGESILSGVAQDGKKIISKPELSPQSYSNLLTFVSRADLYPDQQELYEQFNEAFTGPDVDDAYTILVNHYSNCISLKPNDAQKVKSLLDKSLEIIKGPLWKQVNNRSKSHVPSIEFH